MEFLDWDSLNKCFFKAEILSKIDIQKRRDKFKSKIGISPEKWLIWFYGLERNGEPHTQEETFLYHEAIFLDNKYYEQKDKA